MTAADLDRIAAALPACRTSWRTVLIYVATWATDEVLDCSLNKLMHQDGERPGLRIARSKLIIAVRALRNLRVLSLETVADGPVRATRIRPCVLSEDHLADLLVALARVAELRPRDVQRFCRALERPTAPPDFLDRFGDALRGGRLRPDELLEPSFLTAAEQAGRASDDLR